MKSSLWTVIVVVAGIVGFLVGYTVSAYTGVRPIESAQAAEHGSAKDAAKPAETAGYGAEKAAPKAAAGYGEAAPAKQAAGGYGEAPAPKAAPAPAAKKEKPATPAAGY